jgi:hypothetical protein
MYGTRDHSSSFLAAALHTYEHDARGDAARAGGVGTLMHALPDYARHREISSISTCVPAQRGEACIVSDLGLQLHPTNAHQ